MFSDIKTALAYIESRRAKRTLQQFKETIDKYGFNVHQKNMIHIAGTNGKGSTTNFIKEILMKHGYRVGTFTSPYLICHNDRICINGQMISDEELLRIINSLYEIIEAEKLSMFEIDTLIMLVYFNEQKLDYRIIETGIGGLNDKTNVIDSICSVITNIGYDHQFMLGNSLEEIAMHKAGIIKSGNPCFTSEENESLVDLFKQVCDNKNCQLEVVKTKVNGIYPYSFECHNEQYHLSNCGSYQVKNAALAITVCASLTELQPHLVQVALDEFRWPGRFERFGNIYLDGAHNINGVEALLQTITDQKLEDVVIVFSALGDKDIEEMLMLLQKYPLIMASFDDERLNLEGEDFRSVLTRVKNEYQNVVVTGSLHFISAVRKYLMEK